MIFYFKLLRITKKLDDPCAKILQVAFFLSSCLEFLQTPIQVFEFQNFTNEEVAVAMRNLRVSDMDHVVINVEI